MAIDNIDMNRTDFLRLVISKMVPIDVSESHNSGVSETCNGKRSVNDREDAAKRPRT